MPREEIRSEIWPREVLVDAVGIGHDAFVRHHKERLNCKSGYDNALEKTAELMKREDVNIAEAAFQWENCFIRADIIEKKGNQINLIEVKAKSWHPTESFVTKLNKNKVDAGILEYVYDVAFQKYVIQQ